MKCHTVVVVVEVLELEEVLVYGKSAKLMRG